MSHLLKSLRRMASCGFLSFEHDDLITTFLTLYHLLFYRVGIHALRQL